MLDAHNATEQLRANLMDPTTEQPQRTGARARAPGAGLVMDAADEDDENPEAPVSSSIKHIQATLTKYLDEAVYYGIQQEYQRNGMDTHHRRLQELAADNVCHSWLWALTDKHGPT